MEYTKGDQVLIEVRLDEPQEDVYIHGYDIEELNPSGTVRFDFPAKLDGIFEPEAHAVGRRGACRDRGQPVLSGSE